MTALARARALVARGLSVIPVPAPRPGALPNEPGDGKVPAIAWKPYQSRLATDAELVQWFSREPINLAVVTGALSGVVVIDADSEQAKRWLVRSLPYTPWQAHSGRGWHFYYQHPGFPLRNRAKIETRDGKLALSELSGGTFTITNGGVFGSLLSTPILNPPQTGILGMHTIQDRPVAINKQVEVRPMMYVALTYDHRLVDGQTSVSFLVRIKRLLEEPMQMVLEV